MGPSRGWVSVVAAVVVLALNGTSTAKPPNEKTTQSAAKASTASFEPRVLLQGQWKGAFVDTDCSLFEDLPGPIDLRHCNHFVDSQREGFPAGLHTPCREVHIEGPATAEVTLGCSATTTTFFRRIFTVGAGTPNACKTSTALAEGGGFNGTIRYSSFVLDRTFDIEIAATMTKSGKLTMAGEADDNSPGRIFHATFKAVVQHVSKPSTIPTHGAQLCTENVRGLYNGTVDITQNIAVNQ